MWLLYGFVAVIVGLTFFPTTRMLLFGATSLVVRGGHTALDVERGSVRWLVDLLVVGIVAGATVVLVRGVARSDGPRMRGPVVVAAALVGVAPVLVHVWWSPSSVSRDLGPAGFGVASALLGWGVLRFHLLQLGPVARTLVMVEIQDPIVVLDGKGRIVDVNRTARHTLGLRPYGDVPVNLGTLWARSRQEPMNSPRICLEVATKAGLDEHAFEVTITSLDKRGAPGRSAMVLRDVTDREQMEQELVQARDQLLEANQELERLAKTDELTGLANRRHFLEALDKELDRAARYERSLALVLMDLDHFKRVNDSFGHVAGDEVLKSAAEVLLDISREVDLAARIGGEEMVLLLPETEAVGARAVADRIRMRIEAIQHRSPSGVPFQVTASLGVASVRAGAIAPETLLQWADEAMYRAKEGGRNRVEAAT